MDRDALRARLMGTFLGELDEHVQTMTRDTLALERDPSAVADRLPSLFRTAHSLKGAARAVGLRAIETACHQLETMLGSARDRREALPPDMLPLIFEAAHALAEAAIGLRAGCADAEAPLDALLPSLMRAAAHAPPVPGEVRPTPAPVVPRPAPAPPAPIPAAHTAERPASTHGARVRVPSDTLDALLAGSAELLVARRRTAAQEGDLDALYERLRAWRREWRQLEGPLRHLVRTRTDLLPRRAAAAIRRAGDHLRALERTVDQLTTRATAAQHALDRAATHLDQQIRRARMFPFRDACDTLELSVHELARAVGKRIELRIEGGEIQLDRLVLERVRDPLLHLVRNAVDHGIESPDARAAAGRPPTGTITVSASVQGDTLTIAVADDGPGLPLERIRAVARRSGLPEPADRRAAAALVLRPGFTTAAQVTEMSGRGVGLDAVRHRIESLQGHVDLDTRVPRGVRVVMTMPLTVTTLRALLVRAAGQTFVIPVPHVRRLVRAGARDISMVQGHEVFVDGDRVIPVATLADVLGTGGPAALPGDRVPLMLLSAGGTEAALAVQEFLAEDEVVVKPLGPRLRGVPFVNGATILADGSVALILNAAEVVRVARERPAAGTTAPPCRVTAVRRRVLLADDSVTTRSLQRRILEGAGYEVVAAADGGEAWEWLQHDIPDVLIADVDMPRVDGIELCDAVRGTQRLRHLPIILVTGREGAADRARGLEAGANLYLAKSTFEQQQLLDAVASLV